jgi:hypothetical protein
MKYRNLAMCILLGISVFVTLKEFQLQRSLKYLFTLGTSTKDGDTGKSPSGLKISSTAKVPESTFFILLVLQAGCQPLLIKLFMPTTIVRTTAVLGQEGIKFLASILFLGLSGDWQDVFSGWTISGAILAAGIPAGLYVIQNYCNLMATQVLPPVTFVVLNQTKTLSTAWCCFILMGQRQSQVQVMALVLIVFSTLVVQEIIPLGGSRAKATTTDSPDDPQSEQMENESDSHREEEKTQESLQLLDHIEAGRQLTMGVIPALCASFLSGLGKWA